MTQTQSKPYRVVRKDNGERNPHTGIVGEYKTLEAAKKAQGPYSKSFPNRLGHTINPNVIQILDGGEWRNMLPGEIDPQ